MLSRGHFYMKWLPPSPKDKDEELKIIKIIEKMMIFVKKRKQRLH